MENKCVTNQDCRVISFPCVHDRAGNLTAVNNRQEVPFVIQRVYYLYDVPAGAERGGHAHKEITEVLIAASGSFDVILNDGKNKETIRLDRPNKGLMIQPGIWREIVNFSGGAICMVLASGRYDEADYIREYPDFLILKNGNNTL